MKSGLTYDELGGMGRFGNQLFQIASTIGLALKEKAPYGFNSWDYESYFVNPLPKIDNNIYYTALKGYLQSYKNFEHCYDVIRKQFELKPLDLVVPENTVFIHFRAYSNDLLGNVTHIHPEQLAEYYQEAIKRFPNKNFIVFTDNINAAKKVLSFLNCEIVSSEKWINDFYVMSKCDGGILANSSFSWWAGWLTGGKVVAPQKWFTEKATYETNGYYLKQWEKL